MEEWFLLEKDGLPGKFKDEEQMPSVDEVADTVRLEKLVSPPKPISIPPKDHTSPAVVLMRLARQGYLTHQKTEASTTNGTKEGTWQNSKTKQQVPYRSTTTFRHLEALDGVPDQLLPDSGASVTSWSSPSENMLLSENFESKLLNNSFGIGVNKHWIGWCRGDSTVKERKDRDRRQLTRDLTAEKMEECNNNEYEFVKKKKYDLSVSKFSKILKLSKNWKIIAYLKDQKSME
ncbi:hypothetical protein C1646_773994 [Rhizophagus diaphanus]|nr:hypothetical protein C1646_773994 [Rhizophagus diaphanus] [Rhizophagus sp. MUCL 43196]